MEEVIHQVDLEKAQRLLQNWLAKQATPEAMTWLTSKINKIIQEKPSAIYFMTFSAIPHYFGEGMLTLTKNELEAAESIRKHWHPTNWSLSQTARTYFILACAKPQLNHFKNNIDALLSAADIQELIAIYQALPLFPYPEEFLLAATNGIRSNMQSVFDAIALNNPYPADYFNEVAWNQVVLKTLFVDSPIEQVIGLKRRANPALAHALINTARERFSANRPIKPEIWCLVGLSTTKDTFPLIKALLEDRSPILQEGALLACGHCELPEAKELLKKHPEKVNEIKEKIEKLRHFAQEII